MQAKEGREEGREGGRRTVVKGSLWRVPWPGSRVLLMSWSAAKRVFSALERSLGAATPRRTSSTRNSSTGKAVRGSLRGGELKPKQGGKYKNEFPKKLESFGEERRRRPGQEGSRSQGGQGGGRAQGLGSRIVMLIIIFGGN